MPDRDEPALTPEQLSELRADIERQIDRLLRSLEQTRRAARPVVLDQTSVGRLSRIDAIQNQAMSQGLEAREEAKRAELLEALRRIEEGTYGTCATCGGGIPFGRLQVFPETVRCSRCAIG
jgi:DnaK suppressor protein